MNTTSHLSPDRIKRATRWRFQSVARLTPERLAQQLDAFDNGWLRDAALTWQTIERRDDLIQAVAPKRRKAVARHGWSILPKQGLPPAQAAEAQQHIEALQYFYTHLTTTHALDAAETGGFKMLVRQMMHAVGHRFAVHEVLWRPEAASSRGAQNRPRYLTAEFRYVPLDFFENTTGRLRFLADERAMEGTPLEPGAWMITAGEGLMRATSIAWMLKQLTINDWSLFSERHGTPGVQGVTTAVRNSADWDAMVDAVADLLNGNAIVTSATEDIKVIDLAAGGQMPFPALVERMDRVIAALWRGADLSTLSREHGYGASLQERESCLLEEDDTEMIAETLHQQIDREVIRLVFGEGVEPLARVAVLGAAKECTDFDLKVDAFFLDHGVAIDPDALLERYGRTRTPTVANSMAVANSLETNPPQWIQLTPFGEFRHRQGLQRVDRAAAEAMTAHFKSFWSRLGRAFGGLPFYVGHPDVPELAGPQPDPRARGWIMDLEARADGLYAQVRWTEEGRRMIQDRQFKFYSPYWQVETIGQEAGLPLFRPVRLISAGLTNQPNLPVLPLANQSKADERAFREACEAGALANRVAAPGQTPRRFRTAEHSQTRRLNEVRRARSVGGQRSLARERIDALLRVKTAAGIPFDQAWALLKVEVPELFAQLEQPR